MLHQALKMQTNDMPLSMTGFEMYGQDPTFGFKN
jgi:hypothetical protein